jgi:hypothetical protein
MMWRSRPFCDYMQGSCAIILGKRFFPERVRGVGCEKLCSCAIALQHGFLVFVEASVAAESERTFGRGIKRRASSREHRAESIKRRASSREHQAESIKQRASSREHQAEGREHRAESKSTLPHGNLINSTEAGAIDRRQHEQVTPSISRVLGRPTSQSAVSSASLSS